MGAEGAKAISDITRGAWDDYLRSGRVLRPTQRAGYVWNCMVDRAAVEFADFEGVEVRPMDKTVMYVLHERVAFRLKMLDAKYRTSNIRTRTQALIQRSGRLQLDGMPEDLPIISCGYVLDKSESEIAKVLAVRELGYHVEWFFDIDELAGGQLAPVAPIFPDMGPDLPALPTIRRVKRAQDGEVS
ncbi:hypothetical protein [Nocardia farcinica]|uniref:hypothetical protein n=1 Tax=Nocardia farcinica TaxID=37329 RepID=UPI002455CB0F|nr:hypothetical protein [Nocardia farcinica]